MFSFGRGRGKTAARLSGTVKTSDDLYREAYGFIEAKQPDQAIIRYKKAAELGHASSQFNLGTMFLKGLGCDRDEKIATTWLEAAAAQGHLGALNNLAVIYSSIQGKKLRTIELFRSITEHKNATPEAKVDAQFNWATILREGGEGVTQDEKAIVALFQQAAAGNHAKSQYNLGKAYQDGQGIDRDDALAVHWFAKAAKLGHAAAQCNLALCYLTGQGVAKSLAMATAWFQKAALQGNPDAQYYFGLLTKDKAAALESLRKAAAQEHKEAQYLVAGSYLSGQLDDHKIEKNNAYAAHWFARAAAQGHAKAQYKLGILLTMGWGVTQNLPLALITLKKSASQDNADAEFLVALMNYHGHDQIPKNSKETVKWASRAAARGNKHARSLLVTLYSTGESTDRDLETAWLHGGNPSLTDAATPKLSQMSPDMASSSPIASLTEPSAGIGAGAEVKRSSAPLEIKQEERELLRLMAILADLRGSIRKRKHLGLLHSLVNEISEFSHNNDAAYLASNISRFQTNIAALKDRIDLNIKKEQAALAAAEAKCVPIKKPTPLLSSTKSTVVTTSDSLESHFVYPIARRAKIKDRLAQLHKISSCEFLSADEQLYALLEALRQFFHAISDPRDTAMYAAKADNRSSINPQGYGYRNHIIHASYWLTIYLLPAIKAMCVVVHDLTRNRLEAVEAAEKKSETVENVDYLAVAPPDSLLHYLRTTEVDDTGYLDILIHSKIFIEKMRDTPYLNREQLCALAMAYGRAEAAATMMKYSAQEKHRELYYVEYVQFHESIKSKAPWLRHHISYNTDSFLADVAELHDEQDELTSLETEIAFPPLPRIRSSSKLIPEVKAGVAKDDKEEAEDSVVGSAPTPTVTGVGAGAKKVHNKYGSSYSYASGSYTGLTVSSASSSSSSSSSSPAPGLASASAKKATVAATPTQRF